MACATMYDELRLHLGTGKLKKRYTYLPRGESINMPLNECPGRGRERLSAGKKRKCISHQIRLSTAHRAKKTWRLNAACGATLARRRDTKLGFDAHVFLPARPHTCACVRMFVQPRSWHGVLCHWNPTWTDAEEEHSTSQGLASPAKQTPGD